MLNCTQYWFWEIKMENSKCILLALYNITYTVITYNTHIGTYYTDKGVQQKRNLLWQSIIIIAIAKH